MQEIGSDIGTALKGAAESVKRGISNSSASTKGCVGGAAAGALITRFNTKNGKSIVLGGAAGCAVGALAAKALDDRRKRYKSEEDFYAGESAKLDAYNAKLKSANKKSKARLDGFQRDIAALEKQASDRDAAARKLQSDLAAFSKSNAKLRDQAWVELSVNETNLDAARKRGDDTSKAQTRIEALKEEIATLTGILDEATERQAQVGTFISG